MENIPISLFLYISNLIHVQNPLLLLTEHETIPMPFCTGVSFPITCQQYGIGDVLNIANQLHYSSKVEKQVSPVFLSHGDHQDLLVELSTQPLAFANTKAWVMPLEYATIIPLRLDSNIFFFERTSSNSYTVYEGYAIKGRNIKISALFKWPEEEVKNPIPVRPLTLLEKRSNLDGEMLKTTWLRGFDIGGKNADILLYLQAQLNFSTKTIPPYPHQWGSKTKNGTWNGLVGMLIDKKIDLSFGFSHTGGLMITQARDAVVDYCWSTAKRKIDLFSAQSHKPRLDVWTYVKIFPSTVWLTGICSIFVSAICFSVASPIPVRTDFSSATCRSNHEAAGRVG